jgi:hypothetical protein
VQPAAPVFPRLSEASIPRPELLAFAAVIACATAPAAIIPMLRLGLILYALGVGP